MEFWIPTATVSLIPHSDDDFNRSTEDSDCSLNPTFKFIDCEGEIPFYTCGVTGFWRFDFDDTSWNEGPGFIGGHSGACTTALFAAPGSAFIRKWFDVDSQIPVKVTLKLAYDDGIMCFVNQHLVINLIWLMGEVLPHYWWRSVIDITNYVRPGRNLLACWVRNETTPVEIGGFDVEVEAHYLECSSAWVRTRGSSKEFWVYYGNTGGISGSSGDGTYEITHTAYDLLKMYFYIGLSKDYHKSTYDWVFVGDVPLAEVLLGSEENLP